MKKIAVAFFVYWFEKPKDIYVGPAFDRWAKTKQGEALIKEQADIDNLFFQEFVERNKIIEQRIEDHFKQKRIGNAIIYLAIGLIVGILMHLAYDVYFVQYYKF